MVDKDDRVAVGNQVVHDAVQADDVRGVQPDGWLIQHVQHAGGAVANGAGQLHTLAFPGGERRGRAVQRQVAQPQIHQPLRADTEGLADALGHGAHFRRQAGGYAVHPVAQGGQRHFAGLVQADTPQFWRTSGLRQARAAAVRAGVHPQEFLHPLHALLVLDFGEGVLNGVDGVKVGKVQLARLGGAFCLVEDVLFLCRTVKNNVFLFVCQFTERYVCAHPHGAADIGHQAPHQAVPRCDGPLVDGQGIVRHKGGQVHGAHHAGAITGAASALAVEGQFLCRRRTDARAALRAVNRLLGGNVQRRRDVMAVRAAVARQAGEHQAQTVQEFRSGAEGAADAGHTGPLVQRQRGRHVENFIDLGLGGLGHAAAGVGGQGIQVAPRTLGVEHTQCQRRLARPGHARNADDFIQRHIDVDVF